MLDLEFVRAQFPSLGSGFTFLDNAGGSQTLGRVADRVRDYLLSTNVQLGASYTVSVAATERVSAASRAVAAYVNAADPKEIVLGSSTTQLIGNLALALQDEFTAGDEIVITTADHEANVGAWRRLEKRGLVIKTWNVDRDSLLLEAKDLDAIMTKRTRLVAFAHVSNVLGSLHDVTGLTRAIHERGARVLVDGVAFAPHREIDVRAWDVDYYVFSFYKVYGPHIAMLYGKRELLEAASGINHSFITEVPYKLQPGNVNYELAHSLGGVFEYVDALGAASSAGKRGAFEDIAAHEEALGERLLSWLRGKKGVSIIGEASSDRTRRVPTIAFRFHGVTPEAVVRRVDESRIGIRHGDFYSKGLVGQLGLQASGGVVRASMVHYNTVAEVDRLITALDAATR